MMRAISSVAPQWNAPAGVRAVTTLRAPGTSCGAYAELNLAMHVGDDESCVARNRDLLQRDMRLPSTPLWLRQQHGARVVQADAATLVNADADGCCTRRAGVVCAVLSADCLPVFLCNSDGSAVTLLHAGWRGIAAGVLEAGVAAMGDGAKLLAAFGPAIGAGAYVVGNEVRAAIGDDDGSFRPRGDGHYHADLYAIADARLRRLGVDVAPAPPWCTFNDESKFFSYRRDKNCGRMASLLWMEP